MVDAAYWHLARRYNEAALHDPKAQAKLEELNEAYRVLGSAEKREEYMKQRAAVLGDALPKLPPPEPAPVPLTVMRRQKPREKTQTARNTTPRRRLPALKLALGVALAIAAGLGAFAVLAFVALSPLVLAGTLVGLTATLLAAAGTYLVFSKTRVLRSRARSRSQPDGRAAPRMPSSLTSARADRGSPAHNAPTPISLNSQRGQIRRIGSKSAASEEPPNSPKVG
jgi:curved DNA-binding protein CbpA